MISYALSLLETEAERTRVEQYFKDMCEGMMWDCYEILHNWHDAQDAVSNTFEKIAKDLQKMEAKCESRPALYCYFKKVAKNCAKDICRRNARRPDKTMMEECSEELEVEGMETLATIEENILIAADIKLIERAIGKLKEEQQIVIESHLVYSLSFKEMSKTLGVSPETLHTRYTRAMAKLKIMVAELSREGMA